MTTQCTELDFSGQDIFTGMDISKKSWTICIYVGMYFHRRFTQPPEPDVLLHYLERNFPNARYHCVYEAGYFGFWIHDELTRAGVDCMVINPADVPTTSLEKQRKTDRVDAAKLARSLACGELRPIYTPDRQAQEDRALVRVRQQIVREQTRYKNRIKALLQYYGITTTPAEKSTASEQRHWSRRYLAWLESLTLQYPSGTCALRLLVRELLSRRATLAELTREIRALTRGDRYYHRVKLLCTIPGVSQLAAMVLLTELVEIERFKTLDQMASYAGLTPGEHSSGDKEVNTGLTYRRNVALRTMLVECAWVAVKRDPALLASFTQSAKRMPKNVAIIKIARKLLNRIRFVLKNQQPYQIKVVAAA